MRSSTLGARPPASITANPGYGTVTAHRDPKTCIYIGRQLNRPTIAPDGPTAYVTNLNEATARFGQRRRSSWRDIFDTSWPAEVAVTGHSVFWDDLAQDLADPQFLREYVAESVRIATIDRIINELDGAREAAGLSKAELARAISTEPATVRRLFSAGHVNPTLGARRRTGHARRPGTARR